MNVGPVSGAAVKAIWSRLSTMKTSPSVSWTTMMRWLSIMRANSHRNSRSPMPNSNGTVIRIEAYGSRRKTLWSTSEMYMASSMTLPGRAHQAARDGQHLLLAAGQGHGELLAALLQHRERLEHARQHCLPGRAGPLVGAAGAQGVPGRHPREEG